ncbi:MAG TPA: histidine ammonia-lyase [Bacteroidia bacterium]|jgi:histidine ammonia-lyase|nr:histidine ammonia-lyase [Bacteroidia bacterium]
MKLFAINSKIDFATIKSLIADNARIALSEDAEKKITKARKYLDRKMAESKEPVYGINTGFGALRNVKIPPKDYSLLQTNLIRSHACGSGAEVPAEIVKLMLLLKVQSLSYGHSGVDVSTVERLIDFYNNDILPIVYEQGSLGASGDLAPLAHLCLPLIGEGEVHHKGKRKSTAQLYKDMKWKPLALKPKEGLALLNGTQFMSAYGVWLVMNSQRLAVMGDIIAALSLDGFDCRLEPFSKLVQDVRPHKGQTECAKHIIDILKGSKIASLKKSDVQDPYSFRCIPQVHGAIRDVVEHVQSIILKEINSVTDNPLIFPDEDEIISGGNFHGHPLAMAFDYLGIAMADLGNISERRTYKLISGQRGLPAFLAKDAGLNSGLMIVQYGAASIVSQNKQYATPASVDSIVSSNGQEDYVSMGANAATKCYKIVQNLKTILAIELIAAVQAISFRRPLKTSPLLEKLIADFQKQIPFIDKDRVMHDDIMKSLAFIERHLRS